MLETIDENVISYICNTFSQSHLQPVPCISDSHCAYKGRVSSECRPNLRFSIGPHKSEGTDAQDQLEALRPEGK